MEMAIRLLHRVPSVLYVFPLCPVMGIIRKVNAPQRDLLRRPFSNTSRLHVDECGDCFYNLSLKSCAGERGTLKFCPNEMIGLLGHFLRNGE